jgi:hypothetical protein
MEKRGRKSFFDIAKILGSDSSLGVGGLLPGCCLSCELDSSGHDMNIGKRVPICPCNVNEFFCYFSPMTQMYYQDPDLKEDPGTK